MAWSFAKEHMGNHWLAGDSPWCGQCYKSTWRILDIGMHGMGRWNFLCLQQMAGLIAWPVLISNALSAPWSCSNWPVPMHMIKSFLFTAPPQLLALLSHPTTISTGTLQAIVSHRQYCWDKLFRCKQHIPGTTQPYTHITSLMTWWQGTVCFQHCDSCKWLFPKFVTFRFPVKPHHPQHPALTGATYYRILVDFSNSQPFCTWYWYLP